MRLVVDAADGELARSPERALKGLVRLAVEDGADEHEWIAKALTPHREHEVNGTPRHRIAAEASTRAVELYEQMLDRLQQAVLAELERAWGLDGDR